MDLGSLRALTTSINFSVHGVDATVTRPSPNDTPIVTRAIWVTPDTPAEPSGADFTRSESVDRLSLPLVDVPSVPLKTVIVAAKRGESSRTWLVDSHDHIGEGYTRVFVVPAPGVD